MATAVLETPLPHSHAAGADTDDYLTVEDCARLAKLHKQTIVVALRAKRLRGLRINGGHRWRIRRSWLADWLEAKTNF